MSSTLSRIESSLPPRPRLVLRCGFVGSRRLIPETQWTTTADSEISASPAEPSDRQQFIAERKRLESALPQVFQTLGRQLCDILEPAAASSSVDSNVLKYFASEPPLLRLITGLCEGADALAGEEIERLNVALQPQPDAGGRHRGLTTELAAVLPFDVESYRRSRPAWFHSEFDRQLQACAWVLALDGIHDRPDDRELALLAEQERVARRRLAEARRSRAYRAQGTFLLRHCDLLIAAFNPDQPGKAGGSLETVRQALDFDLPVLFIHTGLEGNNIFVIDPKADFFASLTKFPPSPEQWQAAVREWIRQITIDPESGLSSGKEQEDAQEHGKSLLKEYFEESSCPPRTTSGQRLVGLRERTWNWFERRFRKGPALKREREIQPFSRYRGRATDLNYHYSGQYRGAFFLNYTLAVIAVLFAAASLALLGSAANTSVGAQVSSLLEVSGHLPEKPATEGHSDHKTKSAAWLLPLLLALTITKLGIVVFISRNTRRANLENWNDRAVDYRYLAERLRGLLYLSLAGSHQPPAAKPSQFASRVLQQSTVDWLFDTLVRAISPADLDGTGPTTLPANREHDALVVQRLLTLSPQQALRTVSEDWIAEQAKYHDRNYRTMYSINHWCEALATRLGWIVVVVVALDLVLIGGKVLHWLPDAWLDTAKAVTPWLIFISAVLPAFIAALGGVRFQSECQRLAERSFVMRTLLGGPRGQTGYLAEATSLAEQIRQAEASPEANLGSWSLSVLQLTERVATDFVHEAAEWSVLYAKEVADPG